MDIPGLYILTRLSGNPLRSGSSPPTTTALAPKRCASRILSTNWHSPLCTNAIQVSVRSGSFGPITQSFGQPKFGGMSARKPSPSQGAVKDDSGITYPKRGSVSSAPNAAGLDAKVSGGDRSTMDTVLSPHPHAQLHNQFRSDFAVEVILLRKSIGCE
jgi:hypothetical protein